MAKHWDGFLSHCMISFGAAMCSLTHLISGYRCPISCSLYCIGMMCGGPCLTLDYQAPTRFGLRPLVQPSLYQYIGSTMTALNGQVESPVSIPHCSLLLKEGLAKELARREPLQVINQSTGRCSFYNQVVSNQAHQVLGA